MNVKNRELLEDEIRAELENLAAMELGSEPYKIAVEGLTKLMDRAIDLKKIDSDVDEKEKSRKFDENLKLTQIKIENEFKADQSLKENEFKADQSLKENDLKLVQMKNEKHDRLLTNLITIGGITIPAIITIWGTVKTLNFEKDGTVTTIMGRGFINKLLPKK